MRRFHLSTRLRFRSLLPKIFVILFVFILLPVLVFTMFANYITEESLMEQKRRADLKSIRDLERNLNLLTGSVEDDARLIAASPESLYFFERVASGSDPLSLDASECQTRFQVALGNVAAVSFLSPDGCFIGERKLERGRLSWYFNPSTIALLEPNAAVWTDPFTIELLATRRQIRVIAALVPVHSAGRHLGYVCVYMDTESIHDLVEQYTEEITVLDQAECVVASRQRIPSYVSLYQFRRITYSLLLEDKSVILPIDGERKVISTRKYDKLHLKLVMISSFDSIQSILTDHYNKLVLAAVGGVLFALLAALLLARTFTRPIIKLRDVMAEASGGDLSVRYHSRASDEIEQLGGDFNQFLDTIQQLMALRIDHEKARRELQLQLLQEQVQPHFLYNVLEMVSSLIQCGMSKEALSAIQSLASFYRVSLSKGSDIITIRQEINLTQSYLQLQKMRYVEYMDYMLAIDPRILDFDIPKLTLQPLIENAIYHGLKGRRERGIVSVSGSLAENNTVVFEVYDNGMGMAEEKLASLRALLLHPNGDALPHFGMASVVRRLNIYCDGRALIELTSAAGSYTSVRITIPATGHTREVDE